MEDNNNKDNKNSSKSKFMKIMNSKISNTMSVLMILVAFASFLAIGFSGNVSYAIPDVEYSLPESFSITKLGDRIIGNGFTVQEYYTGETIVYCLEHGNGNVGANNGTYTRADEITDYGLLYLMANIYPNGSSEYSIKNSFIAQTSIWLYLYAEQYAANGGTVDLENLSFSGLDATNPNNPNYVDSKYYISDEDLAKIKGISSISSDAHFDDVSITYTNDIYPLVKGAFDHRFSPERSLTISPRETKISVSSDEKYYLSDLITITASSPENFNGLKIDISGPEGTVLVDENYNEITNLDDLVSGTKFYVKVPIDKIKENNKKVIIDVTGSFKMYSGNYYTGSNSAGDLQTITSVKTVNNNVLDGIDIDLTYTPDVPDTGMSTAQSIYFIGLVILICGMGIIYANARPRKSE